MQEGTAARALMKRAAARVVRRRSTASHESQMLAAFQVFRSMQGPARHKANVKARNRAANKVARASRRVNRLRAR